MGSGPRASAVAGWGSLGRFATRVIARRAVWILVLSAAIVAGAGRDAQAVPIPIPNPLGPISDALGAGAANAAVDAFDAIIAHLFAPVARFVNVELLGWLVAVPNFSGGNVRELESTVCAMGAAALGAVATVAVARYWLAGLAGGGSNGFEALEGLARTIGAALFLPLWPWLFDTGVSLSNMFTSSLMGSGSVSDDSARLLVVGLGAAGALSATGVGEFLMVVIAVLASLLFLALLLLKLVLSISTVLVFVAMPAAVVLWPIPACEWLARLCARAFAVCLLVPACWALCFAAAAAVGVDALGFKGSRSGALDALLEPLVAIMLLWVALALPRSLARVAMLGGGALGGGTVSRAVSYAAGRTLYGAAAQHLPNWAGGHSDAAESSSGSSSGAATAPVAAGAVTVATRGPAAPAAAAAGSGATSAGAGGSTAIGATAGGAAGSQAPAPGGTASPATSAGGAYVPPGPARADVASSGLQSPSFHGREHHHALELLAAESREGHRPVSPAEAADALRTLPANTRRGVGGLVHEHGAGAREHLAYQALGDWTEDQREALRTLAAATPDVRQQAVGEVLGEAPPDVAASSFAARVEEPPASASTHWDDRRSEVSGPHSPAHGAAAPQDPADTAPAPRPPADEGDRDGAEGQR